MSDSVRPHRRQPTRLRRPWDYPGKNTGVGCHFLLQCTKVKSEIKSLSRVWLSAIPWTAAYQAPPSLGFSRQEYWSGVPLPSPSLIRHVYTILSAFVNCMWAIWLSPNFPITQSIDMSLSKLQEWRTGKPGVLQSVGSQRGRYDLEIEQQQKLPVYGVSFCSLIKSAAGPHFMSWITENP